MKHLFLTLSLVATLVLGSCSDPDPSTTTEIIDTTAVSASVDTVAADTTVTVQADSSAADTAAVSAVFL